MRTRWLIVMGILVLVFISVLSFGVTTAQNWTPLESGNVMIGGVPVDGAQTVYTLTAFAGDLVSIRVIGLTPGMDPNVALLTPSQQLIIGSDNEPLNPNPVTARIVYRLPETGTFFVVVSGTAGDFLLTAEVRPAVPATILNLDVVAEVTLPLTDNLPRAFIFNTDPFTATTLHFDADPFTLQAFIEVRDGSGQMIAYMQSNLDNACLSMAPGDEVREVTITGLPAVTGVIRMTLSHAPCVLGSPPAEVQIVPIQVQPIIIEGSCSATSAGTVNIRSGPGLNYPILSFLFANQPVPVIGISQDGRWFYIQSRFLQGWIAGSVVGITGPCDSLPVIAAPPAPPALPTIGIPLITVTPFIITGTPVPTQTPFIITQPPSVITATPGATIAPPTATVVPPSATVIPTNAPTATLETPVPTSTP